MTWWQAAGVLCVGGLTLLAGFFVLVALVAMRSAPLVDDDGLLERSEED